MIDVLEKKIIEKFQQLYSSARQCVLGFLEQLEYKRLLSALELMCLPAEERQRRVQATIALYVGYSDEQEKRII